MARHRGAFVLAVLTAILSASSANYCCPNGTVFVKQTNTCEDTEGGGRGGNIQRNINCTAGTYFLDPMMDPHDQFTVTQDGHLQIGPNVSSYLVPPHTYCITRVQKDNNSSPTSHHIAFVCFPGKEVDLSDDYPNFWRILFGILQATSSAFLFVTLSIYILIPELRDLQGRCIMATVFCQMFGYLLLSLIQFHSHGFTRLFCVLSAYFMYFFMLASFFWLTVNSFNVWRGVWYHGFPLNDRQLFWCYCAFGWLIPIIFLVAALTTDHMPETHEDLLRPNIGLSKCWFHGATEMLVYFYGPMTILLVCNIAFFVMTAMRLWRRGEVENTLPSLRSSRTKCLLYFRLFVVMGVFWIFEVISFTLEGKEHIWRLFDMINCLQGVLIFLVVICRKRVVQALAKRSWGLAVVTAVCPRSCMATPASEQEEAMLTTPCDDETYVPMELAGGEHT